jgi:hypothetical protein
LQFKGGFAFRVRLGRGLADVRAVTVEAALVEHHGCNGEPFPSDQFGGVGVSRPLDRGGVDDHHGGGIVGVLEDAPDAGQRFDVEHLWADRDERQVGQQRGLDAGLRRFAGGVDHREVESFLRRGGQDVFQPGGHAGNHLGVFRPSPVAPVGGGRLWVEVDHQGLVPVLGGEHRQRERQRGLTVTSLLPKNSYFFHNIFIYKFILK